MLEPLFRCNLACAGCGKIDYPDEILNQRLSVAECLEAVDECGAPVVVDRRRRAAAAPRDRADRRGHHRAQEVRLSLHQRAAAGKEDRPVQAQSRISPGRSISTATSEDARPLGVPGRRLRPRGGRRSSSPRRAGFRVNINCTLFDGAEPERVAPVLRRRDGDRASTASRSRPAMPMSARPTRSISSTARKTKELFRGIFRARNGA